MKRKSLPTGRDFLFVEGYGNENPGAFQSPRPLRGATRRLLHLRPALTNFNPRAPCGARPSISAVTVCRSTYFNPRAPCGARRRFGRHAAGRGHFNPRAPCGARPVLPKTSNSERRKFQPTRPLRGATRSAARPTARFGFQPTRPLRGATYVVAVPWSL